MSLIETVSIQDATGEVAQIYGQLKQLLGIVPNGVKAFSASPHRLKVQAGEMAYYANHPTLSRVLTAAIRYVVAADHGCEYCVIVNKMMLKHVGWDEQVIDELPQNPAAAPLNGKESALFLAVLKAVRTPKELNEHDLAELRALGWRDDEILDAVAHGALSIAFDMILNAFDIQPDAR